MGIDFNRFVDLPQDLSKHLCCGICLQILDNAVITLCGHTFCELCIEPVMAKGGCIDQIPPLGFGRKSDPP